MARRAPHNPGSAREPWSGPKARVDWLEGLVSQRAEGETAESAWLRDPVTVCRAPRGYARVYSRWRQDPYGTQLGYAIADGAIERTRLVLKGTGLAQLRAEGVNDRDALLLFLRWGGRCKRIDLAVDVKHPEITPAALHRLHQKRHFVTRLNTPKLFGDVDEGQTFYLGAKDQLLRAYDKSAERRARGAAPLDDGVTRLELELRGDAADRAFKSAVRQVTREGVEWGDSFSRWVCGVLNGKARPLDGPRPRTNVKRAATWKPYDEALAGVTAVRLDASDVERALAAQAAAKVAHLVNQCSFLAMMEEALGTARFLQVVRHRKITGAPMFLAAFMQERGPQLLAMLKDQGIDLTAVDLADLDDEKDVQP